MSRSSRERLFVRGVILLAVVAFALLLAGLAATGCGQPSSKQAGNLIQDSNGHLSKAAEEVKNLGEFNTQWESLVSGQAGKETASQVASLLEQARKREQAALEQVKAAEEAIAKIKDLQVSDEMETWADMKLEALEEQEQFLELELKAMDLRQQAIDSFLAGETVENLLMMEKQISLIEQESREKAKSASDLHKQANAYFKEKDLGK